jgi:hypothetical protein
MTQSFEEVKSELSLDEKILWEQRLLFNKLEGLKRAVFLLIFFICISIFFLLISFMPFSNIFDDFMILQVVILILVLPLGVFFAEIISYRKRLKRLDVRTKDLKNYEEFTVLTNKRWIQKSLFFLKLDYSKYDSDLILIQKDLAIANLLDIEIIYITKGFKSEIFYINFFKSWDKWTEESVLQVILEKSDYLILMETLQKLFSITKEEQGTITHEDRALYVKKRN